MEWKQKGKIDLMERLRAIFAVVSFFVPTIVVLIGM
jgi:hypothetical protein